MKIKKWMACLAAGALLCASLPLQVMTASAAQLGDVDANGQIDALDAAYVLAEAAAIGVGEAGSFTDEQNAAADVTADGAVNAVDASVMLSYAAVSGAGDDFGTIDAYYAMIQEGMMTFEVPDMIIGKKDGRVTISWTPQYGAEGFEIYRSTGSGYSLLKTITSGLTGSYDDTGLDNDASYYYKMRAFRTVNGKIEYTDYCAAQCSSDKLSILNAADLTPHTSFEVYNRQVTEANTTSYTVSLSENDIALLDAFAAEHFPADANREEKLWITMYWIHTEVDYAYSGAAWNEIAGKSWVEAIFVHKKGQCAQYNGAMASMMAYLGYDVSMVQGWRGTYPSNYWQHFWAEVNIGGILYIVECGNLGKNGNWYYFVTPYEDTTKYIRNCVNM